MVDSTFRPGKYPPGIRFIAFVAGILLAGPASAAPAEFTVMSYNICGVCSDETAPFGATEIASVAQWMTDREVMLAGFQEVVWNTPAHRDGRDLCTELGEALESTGWPMESYRSRYVNFLDGGFSGNVIFSRYPILESGEYQLAGVGDANPVIQYVKVEPEPGKPLYFFNTHFNINLGGAIHDEQTAAVLFFMEQFGGSHIAVADWNFSVGSPYYQALVDAGYRETCQTLYGDMCLTVGQAAGSAAPFPKSGQIDMIWANDGVAFADSWSPDETYSDHWPIHATVSLTESQPPLKGPTVNLLRNSDFEDGLTGWSYTASTQLTDGGRYSYGDHSAGIWGPGPLDFSVWQTVTVTPGEAYTPAAMGVAFNPATLQPTTGQVAIGLAHAPISGPTDESILWGPFRTIYPCLHLPLDHRDTVAESDTMTVIVRGRETEPADPQSIRTDFVRLLRFGDTLPNDPTPTPEPRSNGSSWCVK